MDRRTILTKNESVLASDAEDEILMLDIDKGLYFALETVGASIWGYLEEPKSLEEILHLLQEEYEIDEGTCVAETETFLQSLLEEGLILASVPS